MRFGQRWTIPLDYWLSPGKVTRLETVAGQGQQQLIDSFLSFLSRDCLIAVDLVNLGAGLGYFRVYYEGGLPLPWIVHIFQGDSTLLWLLMTLTNWNQGEGGIRLGEACTQATLMTASFWETFLSLYSLPFYNHDCHAEAGSLSREIVATFKS